MSKPNNSDVDIEAIKERLRKMKALADFGIGGERDAAENLIREICSKHNISIDEVKDDIEREHNIPCSCSWQRKIFIQLLGLMRIDQYGDRHCNKLKLKCESRFVTKRGSRRRRVLHFRYFTLCTDLQWLELISKFEVLCTSYKKQLKAFPTAFLMSNDLLMPYNPDAAPPTEKEKEDYDIAIRLSVGIEPTQLHKQLEVKE